MKKAHLEWAFFLDSPRASARVAVARAEPVRNEHGVLADEIPLGCAVAGQDEKAPAPWIWKGSATKA